MEFAFRTDEPLSICHGDRVVAIHARCQRLASGANDAATAAGWVATKDSNEPASILVTDSLEERVAGAAGRVVYLCEPTPIRAQLAVKALLGLEVSAVVATDSPAHLARALDAVLNGSCEMSMRLLRLADQMPSLSERQVSIVSAVAEGLSNAEIGEHLFLSVASIKRELCLIYSDCAIGSRSELVELARTLGIAGHPSTGPTDPLPARIPSHSESDG